ncbi:NAD(P)H-dependent oxidoreductase [Hoeflea sp. TYP-13]|uniref:NAD(P)H-dependent oxidoreductase n=1 Tax=Hoeflea sp. TYP-13 TaxID=3230023 RepID=UPI0034C66E6F
MRILLIFCHPYEESYGAALFDCAQSALAARGHDVRALDLYRDGFEPILGREEWLTYIGETEKNIAAVKSHVDALQWAEGLILIYPTWMYGPPAMLKGWMERVWLPGVAFDVAPGKHKRAVGALKNIRLFIGITTSGSPWWWLRLVRDPGRSLFMRAQRVLFHPLCRMRWLQLHNMNHTTQEDRARFLNKVERALSKV